MRREFPVLTAIALTPSAPVLVPELAGVAAAEVAEFRAAALAAAATLPDRWIAVGVNPGVGSGAAVQIVEPDSRGTFAGYGADVGVALSPQPGANLTALPLCALFAGWLRGQVRPQAQLQVRVYPADCDPEQALVHGRRLRAEIDATAAPVGVLVVADGANTLTQSAPGGHNPDAQPVQGALDDALAAGDADALTRLPDGIVGRVAYQVLAGLAPGPVSATEFLRGAPYGVGYFIGVWAPEPQ